MSSAVAELEAGLQAMLSLKPPGVSGSRIQSITALCTANIQSESLLIQKLYTHFKKAPGTHKLGVLYVLDSVTRKWTEQAKSAGQPINSAAQDGTYGAGVHRVKELLPVLMNDIIQSAPGDQKDKIKKLVDIWEKGQTFPLTMLNEYKDKLNARSQNDSYTPPGTPPVDPLGLQKSTAPVATPAAASNTSSILAALANMARQNQNQSSAPAANPTSQAQGSSYTVPNAQNNYTQQVTGLSQAPHFPPVPPPVNVLAHAANFAHQTQGLNNAAQNFPNSQTNPLAAIPPVIPPSSLDPALAQQLLLIKKLTDAGVSPDQIPSVIAALGSQGAANMLGLGGLPPPPPQYAMQNQVHNAQTGQNGWGANGRPEDSRDRNGFRDGARSPGRNQRRSRSRSPVRGAWNARDSPVSRRRDEPNYDYDRNSPGRNRDDRGRGAVRGGRVNNDYRQRSPPRRRSSTPPRPQGGGEKWIGHDTSIGKGNIKVLSRTLFVGGVTSSDHELRNVFEKFGKVQTCIVNKDKRHAFVKMISRAAAMSAKEGMERNRTPDSQLRTRWGVGFGPRDCSDYQTGVSIIPISKLTDADRKWMLTAEYGGSGGKPIEPGMVVEEPDIEIGQGVSSKAISRRMQTDQSGNNGPKSTRDRDREDMPRRRRGSPDDQDEGRYDDDRKDRFSSNNGPPSMPSIPPFGIPGFPFNLPTLPNGMPMIPPGFVFPGQTQATPPQPPPPGHRT